MAKGTLRFDLEDPDDAQAFERAIKARDMALVLWDFRNKLRDLVEYSDPETDDEKVQGIEQARDAFNEILAEYSIEIDSLID